MRLVGDMLNLMLVYVLYHILDYIIIDLVTTALYQKSEANIFYNHIAQGYGLVLLAGIPIEGEK